MIPVPSSNSGSSSATDLGEGKSPLHASAWPSQSRRSVEAPRAACDHPGGRKKGKLVVWSVSPIAVGIPRCFPVDCTSLVPLFRKAEAVPLAGLEEEEEERSSFSAVTFSPAPHPGHQLGENKWKITISGGRVNEVAPVLPSFLRDFGEMHRGQASLKPTTHRRLGRSGAQQRVPVQREQCCVEQNLQRFQVYLDSTRKSVTCKRCILSKSKK